MTINKYENCDMLKCTLWTHSIPKGKPREGSRGMSVSDHGNTCIVFIWQHSDGIYTNSKIRVIYDYSAGRGYLISH